ncbi:VF530 family DNA-binding protein [Psychromonas sp. KJ10-10]|uniref:VF530 family protein n=1 Tax=Psychromonas sp. KJ10-10 TaxID=3391823 RepID=UPI0039B61058
MSTSVEEQRNNPLHGLSMEKLLTELVEHYGWKILYASMRFHCFKVNPSIEGSLKFLKKTEWARIKLENFYLSRFKRMPKPRDFEFDLAPRERGFSLHIVPREPMELTIESIELSQAKAASAHKERSQQKRDDREFSRHSRGASKHPYRDNQAGPQERPKDRRAKKAQKKAKSHPTIQATLGMSKKIGFGLRAPSFIASILLVFSLVPTLRVEMNRSNT